MERGKCSPKAWGQVVPYLYGRGRGRDCWEGIFSFDFIVILWDSLPQDGLQRGICIDKEGSCFCKLFAYAFLKSAC